MWRIVVNKCKRKRIEKRGKKGQEKLTVKDDGYL